MKFTDVTLSDRAKALCNRFNISELEVRKARSNADTTFEGREFLEVIGELSDGGSIRMQCYLHQDYHVVTFRPIR